jgi:hypothetical protein
MHRSSHWFQSKITTVAFVLMLLAIWLLLCGYHGLIGDGQIYAFQSFARVHPHLASDLYLQNTSQDQFTIFSPFYTWFIEFLGLEHAARLLTLAFTVCYLAAAWALGRILTNDAGAWLAVALLLIYQGGYGSSGVFSFAEPFLTARLPAEALIVTSLACYFRKARVLAIVIATGALLVHPLIALPGLLLLICLSVPLRVTVIGAIACTLAAVSISAVARSFPRMSTLLPIMDPAWLNVVQERSQFLFLHLWSFRDWELNARPFFFLAFTALAVQDIRIRKLCIAVAVVGITGLAVALLASVQNPVALIVQGQAWRWVWIAAFISALLVPATILHTWHNRTPGPLYAILLILGLTLPVDGTACASLALIIWLTRSNLAPRTAAFFQWASIALAVGIAAWIGIHSWQTAAAATQLRDLPGFKTVVALSVVFVWWSLHNRRSVLVPAVFCAILLALSICSLPVAFEQSRTFASATSVAEFSDWEGSIPPTSAVLVTPARDVGTFVWFTLQRPNYLAVDQSAGVVFSRKTAFEIQRRSQNLLPVMDPSWTILTHLRTDPGKPVIDVSTRPLTAAILRQICEDSQLGFVISPQDIGFEHLPHTRAGPWMGWNLYDCHRVRLPRGAN